MFDIQINIQPFSKVILFIIALFLSLSYQTFSSLKYILMVKFVNLHIN